MIFIEFTGAGEDPTHVARLQARSMFKDIRAEAEEYIYKKLVRPELSCFTSFTWQSPV